ncbi:MAG: DUF1800 family protein [Planctomycetes bacterium]|nr:DUF1800 family protein [Planctomycetota bacterium]
MLRVLRAPMLALVLAGQCLAPRAAAASEPLPPACQWIPQDALALLELRRPEAILEKLLDPEAAALVASSPLYKKQAASAGFQIFLGLLGHLEARLGADWRTALRSLLAGGATLAAKADGAALLVLDARDSRTLEVLHDMSLGLARAEATRRGEPDRVASFERGGAAAWSLGPEAAAFDREHDALEAAAAGSGSADALRAWWLRRMVLTPFPLLEKMALFWHGRFGTSAARVKEAGLMLRHVRLLRRNALGSFEVLLQEVAKDAATLVALDSAASRRARPSEGFPRALLERFTVGPGRFSEADVRDAARAFTGRFVLRGELRSFEREHDPGSKRLLGREGKLGGEDVVRILLEEPATARRVVRDLYRWLLSEDDEPSGALLRQLSKSLAAFLDDLKRDGLLDRVLVMTFSEFGRTVQENGRRGTDHGAAAPLFLAGGKVKGGIAGPHPSLTDLDAGGLRHHTDFRRVYATVLDRWLGFDARAVLGGEAGDVLEPLDVLRG